MNSFAFLLPIAFLFGAIALTSFLWSVRGGRFDDLDGASQRIPLRDEREG
ncbi:MAG: cbb3-type cytochrome oxidase assembly protein CcoS [Hyphomicrobiales bacterium]|nr:MAG: cbb3-type cytochrome oxidase assembly protein CcoS [Hyphomicrobiales bacterium]